MRALIKVASYRKVDKHTYLAKGIPLLKKIPQDPEKGRAYLHRHISRSKDTWSHPQVAVRELDLKRHGFKPTRLAVPLPGERLGAKSWRSGELHAHKMGPLYLVHRDASAPTSLSGMLRHTIEDTPKALKIRKGARPAVLHGKASKSILLGS